MCRRRLALACRLPAWLALDAWAWRCPGSDTLGFLCLPGNPRWLASHRSEAEARAVLQRIRATDNVSAEMDAITRAISAEEKRKVAGGTTGLWRACRTPLRRAMTVGVMLQLIQQLRYFNLVVGIIAPL